MSRRGGILPRRAAGEWSVRVALALVAAAAGTWSVRQSFAYLERASAPESAHRLAPGDGRITALLSEKMSNAEDASPAQRIAADRLARLALQQDPTAVAAVATLGIDTQIRGDTARARRIFAYGQALSRRDRRIQLWAIEDAVARNDVEGALKQYDIALRTSSYGPDLLFPVLANAISDSAIRTALIRTLAAQPAWTQFFIDYVAINGSDSRAVFALLAGLQRVHVPVSDRAKALLVSALLKDGFPDEAWTYYASIRPGALRNASRDARFTAQLDTPSPFDWNIVGSVGISAAIQRGTEGGVLDFSAPASVGGPILQQTQLLSPGDYILQGHSLDIDLPAGAAPYWTLACVNGRELGRIAVPNSAQAAGNFEGRFTVPTGCPVQYLLFVARPSDAVSGLNGQIDRVQIRAAQ